MARLWWGLYSLEASTSTILGRPSFLVEDFCSVPLPLPLSIQQISNETGIKGPYENLSSGAVQVDEARSQPNNSGSYLRSIAKSDIITQKIHVKLYSPAVVAKSWKHMQQAMGHLYEELEAWLSALPSGLSFLQANVGTSFQSERHTLHMHYIENKILITRPCMCRLDARIPNQTEASAHFTQRTAQSCVEAAHAFSDLLSESMDITYLSKLGPWWSLAHNLMQALVVLLLEMSYGTTHFRNKDILAPVKNLIRGLRTLARRSQAAERAYAVALDALKSIAAKSTIDISDIIWEDTTRVAFVFERPPVSVPYSQAFGIPGVYPDVSDSTSGDIPPIFAAQPSQWSNAQASEPCWMFDNSFASVHDDDYSGMFAAQYQPDTDDA